MTNVEELNALNATLAANGMPPAVVIALSVVLGYLHDEEKDWDKNDQPDDHIWPYIRMVRDWLQVATNTGTQQEMFP
jgi:hypothetical protein